MREKVGMMKQQVGPVDSLKCSNVDFPLQSYLIESMAGLISKLIIS